MNFYYNSTETTNVNSYVPPPPLSPLFQIFFEWFNYKHLVETYLWKKTQLLTFYGKIMCEKIRCAGNADKFILSNCGEWWRVCIWQIGELDEWMYNQNCAKRISRKIQVFIQTSWSRLLGKNKFVSFVRV